MTQQESVSAAKAALQSGQDALLDQTFGQVYQDGAASVVVNPVVTGTFVQADIDKAVADAKAAQSSVDATALAQAQADGAAALQDLQGKLDAMTSKESAEESVISGLQDSLGKVQSALSAVFGLLPAQPAPAASASGSASVDGSGSAPAST